MHRHSPIAAFALLVVAGCVAGEPTGPPVTILTVSTRSALDVGEIAPGASGTVVELNAGDSDWNRLARLMCADAPAVDDGPFPLLPGSAATLAERASDAGFETAAYVTGEATREEGGLLQGWFHGYDGPSLESLAPGSAERLAAYLGADFVKSKLPRPMEDASFLWVHLDLTGFDAPAAAKLAADAWRQLGEASSSRPDAVRVLALLPAGSTSVTLASTAGTPPSDASLYSLISEQAALPPLEARATGHETCTTHHPTGEVWSVRRYLDGKPNDPWIVWHVNELPQYETDYARGARSGHWFSRAENGYPLFERHYADDEPSGEWLRRRPDESIVSRGSFEGGHRVGIWSEWHPGGQLALEVTFDDRGRPVGEVRRWSANGAPIAR
ncbi:hypothetical protein [Engelhardtia mirabilis]|uniref:MORN repeat variant n=1 Tax=Engelhardtia mirabilis TaxID=2528011 RepID=A0A518BS83_9BACT|nr:hypothetical protein Pla133_49480 [Planctomycetes bacterium Pla133]QDV04152.1 hypothetical protein Pla86_49460 [Planctomycetes bacterium Pla86]